MGMSTLGSFILMITCFGIPSFVAIGALIFLIIITKKFRRQGAVADKKWLAGTIVCVIIAAISFIMNPGWIRVFLLWSGVPWIHISAFLFVGILASYKIRYSKAIKIISILSCLTYLFANFLLPDGTHCFYVSYGGDLGYVKESDVSPFTIPNHSNPLTFIPEETPPPLEEPTTSNDSVDTLRIIIIASLIFAGLSGLVVVIKKRPSVPVNTYYDENDYE